MGVAFTVAVNVAAALPLRPVWACATVHVQPVCRDHRLGIIFMTTIHTELIDHINGELVTIAECCVMSICYAMSRYLCHHNDKPTRISYHGKSAIIDRQSKGPLISGFVNPSV